jgi:hypothetical protein
MFSVSISLPRMLDNVYLIKGDGELKGSTSHDLPKLVHRIKAMAFWDCHVKFIHTWRDHNMYTLEVLFSIGGMSSMLWSIQSFCLMT